MTYLLSLLFAFSTVIASNITKIAIVDTGLDLKDPRFASVLCPTGHKDFSHTSIEDHLGHGTHVAGIVANSKSKDYCLLIIKYFDRHEQSSMDPTLMAFTYAVSQGADIINYSSVGLRSKQEMKLIASYPNTIFVVAAGNDGLDLNKTSHAYPANYGLKNIITVGSVNSEGKRSKFSNFGANVRKWELGEEVMSTLPGGQFGPSSGTSMSAAGYTRRFLDERGKNR